MIDQYVRSISGLNVGMTREEEATASVDELVTSNLKFVIKIAHSYTGNG